MFAVRIAPALQQKDRQRFAAGLKHTLAVALGAVALAGTPDITGAADCPAETRGRVPQAPAPPLNIDKVKEALLAYQAKDYDGDVAMMPALDLSTPQKPKAWRCSSSPGAATASGRPRCGISTAPATKDGPSS
jgi:hypothetical protein